MYIKIADIGTYQMGKDVRNFSCEMPLRIFGVRLLREVRNYRESAKERVHIRMQKGEMKLFSATVSLEDVATDLLGQPPQT